MTLKTGTLFVLLARVKKLPELRLLLPLHLPALGDQKLQCEPVDQLHHHLPLIVLLALRVPCLLRPLAVLGRR